MRPTHANPVVKALNSLSVLGAHQGAAYREHSADARRQLGGDIETGAMKLVRDWTTGRESGVLILTGNAGTGKTALAEIFCQAAGCQPPATDELAEPKPGVFVCKDLSGVGAGRRRQIIDKAVSIAHSDGGLMLLCANEGVLRPLVVHEPSLAGIVDSALLQAIGRSSEDEHVLAVNMNRQRWTGPGMWPRLLAYAVAEDRWTACEDCPAFGNCPMRRNAELMRNRGVQEAMRQVVRLAAAEEVAPLRELLSLVSYAITGGKTCADVIDRNDRHGASGFTAEEAYFHLVFGGGLPPERIEALPVLRALSRLGIGFSADLEVDAWLREASGSAAAESVRRVAGADEHRDVLSQVHVGKETMTFADVGEVITINPDQTLVDEALADMLGRGGRPGYLPLWRRRTFFEAHDALDGIGPALGRLSHVETFGDMLDAVEQLERGNDPVSLRNKLVQGLNYLGCGMAAVGGYMHLPDPGVTAARDLGSLLPAPPLVVVSSLPVERVRLTRRSYDGAEQLDTDDVDLVLEADAGDETEVLTLTPSLFNALILAADFRTPPGPESPNLAALEVFFSRLGRQAPQPDKVQIVAGGSLTTITAPDMEAAFDGRL